jgi:hypothetical protein
MFRILSADPDPAVYLYADPAPDPGFAVTQKSRYFTFLFFKLHLFIKDKFNFASFI